MPKKIILASQSPRRKQLLRKAGYSIRVVPSQIKEKKTHVSPGYLAKYNATLKAKDIAKGFREGVVLGADTLIYFQKKIIGKPKNKKEAFRILKRLQGKTHWVYTGVCLVWPKTNRKVTFFDKSKVIFKKLSNQEIRKYHSLMNPLDKAGAYAINEKGHLVILKYDGSYTNIVGLPMEKLKKVLRK